MSDKYYVGAFIFLCVLVAAFGLVTVWRIWKLRRSSDDPRQRRRYFIGALRELRNAVVWLIIAGVFGLAEYHPGDGLRRLTVWLLVGLFFLGAASWVMMIDQLYWEHLDAKEEEKKRNRDLDEVERTIRRAAEILEHGTTREG